MTAARFFFALAGVAGAALFRATEEIFEGQARKTFPGVQEREAPKIGNSPVHELRSGEPGTSAAHVGQTKALGVSHAELNDISSTSAKDSYYSEKCKRFYLEPAPPGYPWGVGAYDDTTKMFRPATEVEATVHGGESLKTWPKAEFKRMVTYEDVATPIDYHGVGTNGKRNHCMHYAVRTPQRPVKTMAGTGRNGETFAMPSVWKSGSTSFNEMFMHSTKDFHPEHSHNNRSASCEERFELPQCNMHSSFDSSGAEKKFAAVRNPLDRFISSIKEHHDFRICDGQACEKDIELGRTKAARLLSEFPYSWSSCEHATQSYLLSGTDIYGNPMAFDGIVRLEDLDSGLHEVETMLGQTLPKVHLNGKDPAAKKMLYDAVYRDHATLCAICKVYAQDFECFGYSTPAKCTEEDCASVGVTLGWKSLPAFQGREALTATHGNTTAGHTAAEREVEHVRAIASDDFATHHSGDPVRSEVLMSIVDHDGVSAKDIRRQMPDTANSDSRAAVAASRSLSMSEGSNLKETELTEIMNDLVITRWNWRDRWVYFESANISSERRGKSFPRFFEKFDCVRTRLFQKSSPECNTLLCDTHAANMRACDNGIKTGKINVTSGRFVAFLGTDRHLSKLVTRVRSIGSHFSKIYFEAYDHLYDDIDVLPTGIAGKYVGHADYDRLLPLATGNLLQKQMKVLGAFGKPTDIVGHEWGRKNWLRGRRRFRIGNPSRRSAQKLCKRAESEETSMQKWLYCDDVPPASWWTTVSNYSFMLNPTGLGIQSSKFYDALLMRTIPICMKEAAFVKLQQKGWPLVLVDDFNEVTEDKLAQWYEMYQPQLRTVHKYLFLENYWTYLEQGKML